MLVGEDRLDRIVRLFRVGEIRLGEVSEFKRGELR